MAEAFVVKSLVAQLRSPDGSYSHVYQGAVVPELFEGDAERLHAEGLIGPADQDFVVDPETRKGKWIKRNGAPKAGPSAPPADDRPKGNAPLEDWQAYAKSEGMTDEELDGKTRDELRDLYK